MRLHTGILHYDNGDTAAIITRLTPDAYWPDLLDKTHGTAPPTLTERFHNLEADAWETVAGLDYEPIDTAGIDRWPVTVIIHGPLGSTSCVIEGPEPLEHVSIECGHGTIITAPEPPVVHGVDAWTITYTPTAPDEDSDITIQIVHTSGQRPPQ